MDKKLSQKEYLKKYLSSGKDKKKTKKKKPNLGPKTVKIIDDDIDLKNMRAIEDGEIDIYANNEDGPQIAGIIDERGPVDFSDKKRWKIITDDGFGDISVTSISRDATIPDELSVKNKTTDPMSMKNRSGSPDSDCSPPRKSKRHSDSDESRKKKSSSKKLGRKVSSPVRNRSGSGDSDFSPPRRAVRHSDSDEEPRRKKTSKKRQREVPSPVHNRSLSHDSDFSPPRRQKKDSDSDLSPPRHSKATKREKENNSKEEGDYNSRRKGDGKYHNRRRENSNSKDSRRRDHNEKSSRNRNSISPEHRNYSHKAGRHPDDKISSEFNSRHEKRSRRDRKRKDCTSESPRNRRKEGERKSTATHPKRIENNSDSDLSPPREPKKKTRNFEPESESSFAQKSKNYQQMSEETSGFGQAPIFRDRKTGRRRDLAAEAREQEEKDGKRQELEEKYAQWGRGLKQVEDRQEKLDRDLYEMSKPLARYADDADLERELKAQEREGDPMLEYMKRKHVKEGKQEPEKPRYNGPSMPNRFGIRPGYRWDGVDRSNGYEKKWFEAQNARKAVQEEAYKWSTADM